MISIEIDNSICKIENLDIKTHRAIKKVLSYTVKPENAYYAKYYTYTKYLIDKHGRFPTGCLRRVERFFKQKKIPYITRDQRRVPTPKSSINDRFELLATTLPYPEQKAAGEAAKALKRGIIVASTGVGKSMICTLIINELQVNTLVVVPSLELQRQLTETLSRAFGHSKVGKDKPICILNVNSNALKNLKTQYDCVIIDEFHHSGAKTYRKLNDKYWNKIYYKFGLTATPFRSQSSEQILLESVLSDVIYEIEYETAVNKGYIVPMEAYYYEVPRSTTPKTRFHDVYLDLVVHNSARNAIICELLRSLLSSGKSVLCLVKEIDHGNLLSKETGIMFANGQDDDSADMIKFFNQGKIKVLIGTTGILGEGVDTKPAEYIIIAGLGKSKNAFMQQCGRGFRTYPGKESCKVILFKDLSHRYTKNHFQAQVKHLKDEYNLIPAKIV